MSKRTSVALALAAFCLLAVASPASAAVDARILGFPDVSEDRITFVYAGDIWVMPKGGGQAIRLSTPAGGESFPRFSPDGKSIAFTGNYDGNQDIYRIPVEGGIPERLTHHPGPDRMLDWYADGESILYATLMTSGKLRFRQLYKLPAEGGLAEKLPVPYGEFGSISDDGRKLAYMPVSRDFRTWKRYRGGSTTDVWIFDLKDKSSKNITASRSNDGQPMWHGSTVYFQSDRDKAQRSNIWAYDTKTEKLRQITNFTKFDVRFPAIGPKDLVFENGGRLYLMDLATEKFKEVEVEVVTDKSTLKPRQVATQNWLSWADISPSGKRAVFEARGEVFTVPAEHGVVRNLSRTSGVAERFPAWSPDGTEIAYFSDKSGEYELTVRASNGSGEEETLTKLGEGFRYAPYWSPDGKKLAYVDQAMKIWIYDREKDKAIEVDQGLYMMHGALSGFDVSWSADSRWMAYHRDLDTRLRAIFLYDTQEGERHQVTAGFYDDSNPSFDPDGKYLYIMTGRQWRPVYSDIDTTWVYNNMTGIAAIPLRNDVPSPLAPRNDEEEIEKDDDEDEGEKDGDDEDGDGKKKKKGKKDEDGEDEDEGDDDEEKDDDTPEPVEIDIEGFERRLVMLPAEPGNYADLDGVSGKVVYHRRPRTGSGGGDSPLVFFDLEEREEKTVVDNANWYVISTDEKKVLVGLGNNASIVDLAPDQKLDKQLAMGDMAMVVDPMAEWKQIFRDAWRIERDYFYDPNMHGVDWDEMYKRYGGVLEHAVTRADVNFVLGELIGELNASHAYRAGGDQEFGLNQNVGLLGADFEMGDGTYRIKHIVDGAEWDSEQRSPLSRPGIEVSEGDYLLAVNGAPLDTGKDPWAAFQGLAGKTVMLTVNDKPEMEGARDVLVDAINVGEEWRLRNLEWIEQKRQKVEEATDGRVGYVYVPSTGIGGQNELRRMFVPQFTKEALIIDERFNNGGQIPTRFIEMLNRPMTNYWGVRDGKDWQWPPTSHVGPKAMLINQWSGSGGDCFPYYFRQAGLGPLIGWTTWGGLIGISGSPQLVDGGVVTVPTFSFYSPDGDWVVENEGVAPDIEVADDPALMQDGGDPQLERAIEEMLKALDTADPPHPKRPKNPIRSGR